jgi:hypothetical protein
MDLYLMGNRDGRRLGLIQAALQGRITNGEGAQALGLSVRQFKRLRSRVRRLGPKGLFHGNRGRTSTRRLPERTRQRVRELLTGEVKVNDHHIADLVSDEGHPVSAASVRRERQRLKLPPKQRRRLKRYRRRRERAARRGALVLIDGSPYAWFEDGGVRYSLLGAIDDATGEILALTFRPTEDLHGYVVLLRDLIRAHGVPLALYGDRSAILIRNDDSWTLAEELAGRQTPTQFGCMLEELGIRFIAATSPQAKGRIERLWGTLQDRLVTELRLLGHDTLAAAEAYLPLFRARHNQDRACSPRESATAFRPAPRDLDRLLACRYARVVARDNTVSLPGRWLQIPPGPRQRSWHPARVELRELLDGRLLVFHPRHGLIAEQPAPAGPFTLESRGARRERQRRAQADVTGSLVSPKRPRPQPQPRRRKTGVGTLTHIRRPAADHPWKRRTTPNLQPRAAGAGGT